MSLKEELRTSAETFIECTKNIIIINIIEYIIENCKKSAKEGYFQYIIDEDELNDFILDKFNLNLDLCLNYNAFWEDILSSLNKEGLIVEKYINYMNNDLQTIKISW